MHSFLLLLRIFVFKHLSHSDELLHLSQKGIDSLHNIHFFNFILAQVSIYKIISLIIFYYYI